VSDVVARRFIPFIPFIFVIGFVHLFTPTSPVERARGLPVLAGKLSMTYRRERRPMCKYFHIPLGRKRIIHKPVDQSLCNGTGGL
jgi:hypothetical protein